MSLKYTCNLCQMTSLVQRYICVNDTMQIPFAFDFLELFIKSRERLLTRGFCFLLKKTQSVISHSTLQGVWCCEVEQQHHRLWKENGVGEIWLLLVALCKSWQWQQIFWHCCTGQLKTLSYAQKKAHWHCFGKDQTSSFVSELRMATRVLASGGEVYCLWFSLRIPLDGAALPGVHSVC